MEPFEVACPHCSAAIRVKSPKILGKEVNCPACRGPLIIQLEEEEDENEVLAGAASQVSSINVKGLAFREGGSSIVDYGVKSTFDEASQSYIFDDSTSDSGQDSFTDAEASAASGAPLFSPQSSPSQDRAYQPKRSASPGYKRDKSGDWVVIGAVSGVSLLLATILGIYMLGSKGYFGSDDRLERQDGTKFAEFSRTIDPAKDWPGATTRPLGLEKQISRQLKDALEEYPKASVEIRSIQTRFQRLRSGKVEDFGKYQQQLLSIQTELRKIIKQNGGSVEGEH